MRDRASKIAARQCRIKAQYVSFLNFHLAECNRLRQTDFYKDDWNYGITIWWAQPRLHLLYVKHVQRIYANCYFLQFFYWLKNNTTGNVVVVLLFKR